MRTIGYPDAKESKEYAGRHANKSWSWMYRKYWRREVNSWDFAPKDGQLLYQHARTPIKRHIKVRNTKSPYDGDWVYWVKRRGKQPDIPRRVATLLKQQAGKCAFCGLYIHVEDKLEVDHIIPKSKGGKDGYYNWQLLHAHCHHRKTAKDAHLQRLEVLMATASRMVLSCSSIGQLQSRFFAESVETSIWLGSTIALSFRIINTWTSYMNKGE